jgi:hypothetical protein
MNRKRILRLAQLPPPIHGAAVMNEHVVSQVLPKSNLDYSVLEMDFSKSFDELPTSNLCSPPTTQLGVSMMWQTNIYIVMGTLRA